MIINYPRLRQHVGLREKLIAASFALALVVGIFQVATANAAAPDITFELPEMTPRESPPVSQGQAVQLALQEAQTPFSGGLTVHQVDPQPSKVNFYYSLGVYPKLLITFSAMFFWPMGYCPGVIRVQVAADTEKIDTKKVTETLTNESTPTTLPSQNPTVTPELTPTITPAPTPTPSQALCIPPNSLPVAEFEWGWLLLPGKGFSVFPLSEGGFVLNAADESATFLVKTDAEGNLKSVKAIQISGETTLLPYFTPTADGGYAFGGVWANQFALVKTDSDGNVQWTRLYVSEAPTNYFRHFIQTRDGGFAIAGYGELWEEGEGWIWLAKTDADGNLSWNKTVAGPIADCPSTIIELDDGYMLSDVSFSVEPNQAYFRLIRTDRDGKVLWNQTYGGTGQYRIPECNCAIRTADSGYLLGGFLAGRNAWVVKTDGEGVMQWNQTYGGKNSAVTCIKETGDGGYVMTAVENATEAWIFGTDSAGNMFWNMTFPDVTFSVGLEANFNSVMETENGDYVVLGTRNGNVWLGKIANPESAPPLPFLIFTGFVVAAVIAVVGALILVKSEKVPKMTCAMRSVCFFFRVKMSGDPSLGK
jgi:hypothetical protein